MSYEDVKEYEDAPLNDLLGNKGHTQGIANVKVKYRAKGNPNANKWGRKFGRRLGILKGDTKIDDVVETFKNKTGSISKILGNQKTGQSTSLKLELTNLTPYAKNLMHGSDLPFEVFYTNNPGNRKAVITLDSSLASGHTFTVTFKTTNTETGVESSPTVVSELFDTDLATTTDLILNAIKANSGIDQILTTYNTNVFNIKAKSKHVLTITVAATVIGTSAPNVATVLSDTSIVASTVDESGIIDNMSISLDDASKFKKGMQVEIPTGNEDIGVDMEYPYIDYVDYDNNIIYFIDGLELLPEDGVDVKCVSGFLFHTGGNSLPPDIELRIEEEDHSDKSCDMLYMWTASQTAHEGPFRTAEGEEGSLTWEIIPERILVNGKYRFEPYQRKTVNSIVGDD